MGKNCDMFLNETVESHIPEQRMDEHRGLPS